MHIQIANAMMQFHIYSQYMLYLTIYIHVENYVENTSLERERKREIFMVASNNAAYKVVSSSSSYNII